MLANFSGYWVSPRKIPSHRLPNHLPNSGAGLAQLLPRCLNFAWAAGDLLDDALGLIGDLARCAQQSSIRPLLALFPLAALLARG